jgi:hypothetical protein
MIAYVEPISWQDTLFWICSDPTNAIKMFGALKSAKKLFPDHFLPTLETMVVTRSEMRFIRRTLTTTTAPAGNLYGGMGEKALRV